MTLIEHHGGGSLFEKMPSLFPEKEFSILEAKLWGLHYEQRERNRPKK